MARETAEEAGDVALEKEAWLSATLLEWGSCGKIVYVDSHPAGYVTYAPPVHVPRGAAFPTSPVSGDAVLLMTARLLPEFAGGGLGRMLVQAAAKDLTRRGVRALEAFGRVGENLPPGGCVVPADFLLAVGFKTVRPHHGFPRLRLDLRSAAVLARGHGGRPGAAARVDEPGAGLPAGLSSSTPQPLGDPQARRSARPRPRAGTAAAPQRPPPRPARPGRRGRPAAAASPGLVR